MSSEKIVISGTGCALADFLYNGISFNGTVFGKYSSRKTGDGGLSPGRLVFTEELEKVTGLSYRKILCDIIGNRQPDAFNVGGPSLVSLIHASQLLDTSMFEVRFYGIAGNDETADKIFDIVRATPLNIEKYTASGSSPTPSTDVFSDPSYNSGTGERTFVNNIGAAWEFLPEHLDDSFFNSHIVCFGGTALVPHIHDNLTTLLTRAKEKNCITLVNTVFDFRNEKNRPGLPWPVVNSEEDFKKIDILIMDCEEALKISGQADIEKAADYFASTAVDSFIITNGAGELFAESKGGLFERSQLLRLPVSEKVTLGLKSGASGDTTGCGDNFAGGIIASLACQIRNKQKGEIDFKEAISWGVASGGFACFMTGGTYHEKIRGEKLEKVMDLKEAYLKQIGKGTGCIVKNKLVLFGAGKIGRSFIGQLFSEGGYEVVFIDINKALINALNENGRYQVIIKSDKEEVLNINNVRGVHCRDEEKVILEVATAGIIAVSVGMEGLESVINLLAKGLIMRERIDSHSAVDIIIAENMRDGDIFFTNRLKELLPGCYPFEKLVGLVETSIGKMVPIMKKEDIQNDILRVFAEPYNTLILNEKGFRNPIPGITGLSTKKNMKAWVDRKLFIHNLGHSTTAYIGYLYDPDFVYLYEALDVDEIHRNVRATMIQASDILLKHYPEEFSAIDLISHIDDLLCRFRNRHLGDTIYRVGCDLMRKLGRHDRLAGAIHEAIALDLPYDRILYALVCGCHFRGKDEDGKMFKGDLDFEQTCEKGITYILTEVCGFDMAINTRLFREAVTIDMQLVKMKQEYIK